MKFKRFSLVHADHQVPYGLLKKALKMIDSEEKKGSHVVDFGEIVGFSEVVTVSEEDEFFEMKRGDRPYLSRYVKNKLPIECSKLAIIWRRVNEDVIQVITAYFTDRSNPECPDEPANILRKIKNGRKISREAMEASLDFWSTHAFVEPIPIEFLK